MSIGVADAYANILLVDEVSCNCGFCLWILLKVGVSRMLMLAPVSTITSILQFPILTLVFGGFEAQP